MTNSTIFDFVAKLQNTRSLTDIQSTLAEKLSEYGYSQFVYAVVPTAHNPSPKDYINLNTLNEEWMDVYIQEAFMEVDYALLHSLRFDHPLLWSDMNRMIDSGEIRGKMADAIHIGQDFGVDRGITFPLQCSGLYRAGISVIADRDAASHDVDNHFNSHATEVKTVLDVFHVFADIGTIAHQHYGLTDKEIEVLRWLSDGLQVKQIASKTGRSESTLEKQIVSAKRRLNAATTVQAVTKAALLNLL